MASKKGQKQRAQIMAQARKQGNMSLSEAQKAKLTAGQKKKLGIGVTQTGLDYPGKTKGGTDFSTVPQTPGAISADGTRLVPVGTPGSTVPNSGGGTPPPPTFNFNNVPDDPQYTLDRAARERALQTSLATYRAGEDAAASDFGIGFNRYASDVTDAQGRVIARQGDVDFSSFRMPDQSRYDADRGFDTANPFSRASLLNQAFTTNRKMSMGGYANRGLLTSGAYGRAQYRDADRYNRGASDLQKEFAGRLGEYRAQQNQARSEFDTSSIDDRRQLVQRALQQFQLNNPSA